MATTKTTRKAGRSTAKQSARTKALKSATSRVKTRAPIDFPRSVRGR